MRSRTILIFRAFCVSFLTLSAPGLAAADGGDLSRAPRSFQTSGGKAVFVDFKTARASINFDVASKTTRVTAAIDYEQAEDGFPVIDLMDGATRVTLDGLDVSSALYSEVRDPPGHHDSPCVARRLKVGGRASFGD